MRCEAAFWFECPGTVPFPEPYPSIKAALEEFDDLVRTYHRFGGSKPVGNVVCDDGRTFVLELGPRDGVVRIEV